MSDTPADQLADLMVEKDTLLLTVKVDSREQADEILQWMYAPDDMKPMKAELTNIGWNQTPVSSELAELIERLRELL